MICDNNDREGLKYAIDINVNEMLFSQLKKTIMSAQWNSVYYVVNIVNDENNNNNNGSNENNGNNTDTNN